VTRSILELAGEQGNHQMNNTLDSNTSDAVEGIGIKRFVGVHYYVHDLERSRQFYVDLMDFHQIARSSKALEERGRQRSLAFAAGDYMVLCSTPMGQGGRAYRYLQHHPDGVGSLVFEVHDIRRAFALLEGRGGTPIDDIKTQSDNAGSYHSFSITTPFGGTTFRFIQREGYAGFIPGMEPCETTGGANRLQITHADHITSNFETMAPALLWLQHVIGLTPFWQVAFHTEDVAVAQARAGSGLRSKVMWDPASGVKFANNEPYRPYFKQSQINIFFEQQRGDGVQHVALATKDIVSAVRDLQKRNVRFMPTPGTYYDALPERLESEGIGEIDEDLDELRQLGILVDGDGQHSYLLQIFLQDSAEFHGNRSAGPFFYELIQRKGDRGFGAGNFRALFESIERQQATQDDRSKAGGGVSR
jgi:4-hydroxyphenylpyruvate dioxygenase